MGFTGLRQALTKACVAIGLGDRADVRSIGESDAVGEGDEASRAAACIAAMLADKGRFSVASDEARLKLLASVYGGMVARFLENGAIVGSEGGL